MGGNGFGDRSADRLHIPEANSRERDIKSRHIHQRPDNKAERVPAYQEVASGQNSGHRETASRARSFGQSADCANVFEVDRDKLDDRRRCGARQQRQPVDGDQLKAQ